MVSNLIDDELVSDLTNKAVHDDIDVIWTDGLSPYTPPCASIAKRRIIMNLRWFNQRELAFQLGHEMTHIYLGTPSDRILYYCSSSSQNSVEYAANSGALDLLIPYYVDGMEANQINSVEFMERYAVPSHLESIVKSKLSNYFK